VDVFGSFALLLAFVCATYAFVGGIAAIRTRHPLLVKSARQAGMATCGLIFVATGSLVYLFFSDSYWVSYVVAHSNRDLSTFYKVAALWSGQEGSLLFWSFLLAIYVCSVLIAYRNKNGELMPYVGVVMAGVQIFFLTLNNFVASPFKVLASPGANGALDIFTRSDGNGLNPLLQYPEMVIHPPNLYSGYTGFTIPFAFALGALLARYPGEKWIHLTRKWTMIAWCFQTVGILLGWGGYWGWDPVENASLLPWLTGTAFLHSVMMQEKRGMMKVWNVWLVFFTFMLCITGTMLTRSGVVSSVHAFAQSSIGNWFLGFLALIFIVCFAAYLKNRDYLKSENQLDSMISRESSFLFNNLILLVSCVAVLSGTLFPVFSEWLSGSRISVGKPFFDKVNIPVGLILLFLTGVGPLLAWRKTSAESLKRNFGWPALSGIVASVVLFAVGVREFYSLVCLSSCVFVTATIGLEFLRGARVLRSRSGASLLASVVDLTMRNTRRYGGYIVHMGMVLIFVGLGGAAFNRDVQKEMQLGSTLNIGRYDLVLQSMDSKPEKNYTAQRMIVEVMRDGKSVMMLYPERRFFPANQESGTMVAIYSTLREDLYVVYAGQSPDNEIPVIHAYLNPLVKWIWLGGVVVVLGTFVTLLPNRRAVLALSGVQQPAVASPIAQSLAPSVTLREGHD
jgi:cytochrome c-type biogenesis protein CcmF